MKKKYLLLLLPFMLFVLNSGAYCQDVNEMSPKGFEFLRQILFNEGVKDSLQIQAYSGKYNQLLHDVLKNIDREDDIYDQNEDLFKYLHKNCLIKYVENLRFREIFDQKYYNCVSASALYYALCLDLGYTSRIYATLYHVYLKVFQGNKPIRIELTDPVNGFDYKEKKSKEEEIQSLLESKLITQDELDKRGIDDIYNEFIGELKEISPLNLIQIVRSNAAIDLIEKEKFDEAFSEVRSSINTDTSFSSLKINYWYVWQEVFDHYVKVNNYLKLDSLLRDALIYKNFSTDIKKAILSNARTYINNSIVDSRPVEEIDPVYEKCKAVLQNESFFAEYMSEAKNKLELYRTIDLLKKGFIPEGYKHISALYKNDKNNGRVKDIYMAASVLFISWLIQNEEYEKAVTDADTLLQSFPDYPAIQELYLNSLSACVSKQQEPALEWNEKVFLRVAQITPAGPTIKKAIGRLYHEYAMLMVRKNNYKEALKIIEQGLKSDSSNKDLLADMDLIKPRVKR